MKERESEREGGRNREGGEEEQVEKVEKVVRVEITMNPAFPLTENMPCNKRLNNNSAAFQLSAFMETSVCTPTVRLSKSNAYLFPFCHPLLWDRWVWHQIQIF